MIVQLNTLFVTSDGAYLKKDHETLVVSVAGETRAQLPMLHLAGVACFGRVSVSPDLMAALVEAGRHVAFFSAQGRFLARIEGMPGGNVLLRRAQFRAADDPVRSLEISRSMVIGKVANARQFLLHARRDASIERREPLRRACSQLALLLRGLAKARRLAVVRGLEGAAARGYFNVLDLLIKRSGDGFSFKTRSRRPPRDRTNALLSFGYALLMQDCAGALAGVGLDPAVGFLHEERPGRLSLALDLMEELRVPIVDRLVVSLINRQQLNEGDLIAEDSGAWRLTDAGRKAILVAYQESKMVEVRHSFLDQPTQWGRVAHLQALLLARTLRGDLEVYPPFRLR